MNSLNYVNTEIYLCQTAQIPSSLRILCSFMYTVNCPDVFSSETNISLWFYIKSRCIRIYFLQGYVDVSTQTMMSSSAHSDVLQHSENTISVTLNSKGVHKNKNHILRPENRHRMSPGSSSKPCEHIHYALKKTEFTQCGHSPPCIL